MAFNSSLPRSTKPLAPGEPPKRKKPMRKASKGLCAKKRAQRRAYAAAADAEQCWCTACGKAGPVEHSHLFSQGNHDKHRNDERNWQLLCRACHDLFEHKKGRFAQLYPVAWADALQRMQEVDPVAFQAFKHPTL